MSQNNLLVVVSTVLKNVNLNEILNKASSLDISMFDENKKIRVVTIAVSCVCNGPIGVTVDKDLPLVGKVNLKNEFNVTSRSWKEFCRIVKKILWEDKGFDVKVCLTYGCQGDLWPFEDAAVTHEWAQGGIVFFEDARIVTPLVKPKQQRKNQ